jgi:short-subunit dehydrogenase
MIARGTGTVLNISGGTRTEAQATAGIDISKVPAFLAETPARVAEAALLAAASGRLVTHVGWVNRLAALGGRHLPHRVLVPATAAYVRRIRVVEPAT